MQKSAFPIGRRVVARLACQASAVAIGIATPYAAMAQCVPQNPAAGAEVVCSGLESNGLAIITANTVTSVLAGAEVRGNGGAAIDYAMPSSASSWTRYGQLQVEGLVNGNGNAGIAIHSGTLDTGWDPNESRISVTTLAGSSIDGTVGILLDATPGNPYGKSVLILNNAGTISGASGVAIQALDNTLSGIGYLFNSQTGVIGAIDGAFGTVNNAGLIDGGARSALAGREGVYYPFYGLLTNSGFIRSAGNDATVIVGTYGEVTNSGTIMNGGVGLAISKASGSLNIQNADTGVISTQGDNAVRAEQLTLRNDGFIRGSVISFGQYTYIDNRRGTIDGDVVMGNGENFFIGRVTAAGVVETGVTGSILGGWNKDSFGIVAAQSATLSGTLLPAGFERLSLIAEEGATLTIGAGAVAPGRVTISGNGTIVNATTISGSDTVVQSDFGGNTSFRNDGSILSLWGTDASSYAVYTGGAGCSSTPAKWFRHRAAFPDPMRSKTMG